MFVTSEKKERALGTRLNLKPYRCSSPKCAAVRKPYQPGMHGNVKGKRRSQPSEMKIQLQEKQRLRLTYGLREAAIRRAVVEAIAKRGPTPEILMGILESRLDSLAFRLGFAPSRSIARQLVNHGHITVNGRKVTISSYRVKAHDVVGIRIQSKEHPLVKNAKESLAKHEAPVWLALDPEAMTGTVLTAPKDLQIPFDISLIIDYYSK